MNEGFPSLALPAVCLIFDSLQRLFLASPNGCSVIKLHFPSIDIHHQIRSSLVETLPGLDEFFEEKIVTLDLNDDEELQLAAFLKQKMHHWKARELFSKIGPTSITLWGVSVEPYPDDFGAGIRAT